MQLIDSHSHSIKHRMIPTSHDSRLWRFIFGLFFLKWGPPCSKTSIDYSKIDSKSWQLLKWRENRKYLFDWVIPHSYIRIRNSTEIEMRFFMLNGNKNMLENAHYKNRADALKAPMWMVSESVLNHCYTLNDEAFYFYRFFLVYIDIERVPIAKLWEKIRII